MTNVAEGKKKVTAKAKKVIKSQKHLVRSITVALQASCLTLAYGVGYCTGVATGAVKDTVNKHSSLAFANEVGSELTRGYVDGEEGVVFNGEEVKVNA